MNSVLEFFNSLSVVGIILVILSVLVILNLGKIFHLRSPLDSQQHKLWRNTGGITKADHLEEKDKNE